MRDISSFLSPVALITALSALLIALVFVRLSRKLLRRVLGLDEDLERILAQKKSSEVRIGYITESLAPLLESFPVDVQKPGTTTVFLGKPIDYIHFDPEEGITFIEVKSGNARPSRTQRQMRDLINDGQVHWCEFSVGGQKGQGAKTPTLRGSLRRAIGRKR